MQAQHRTASLQEHALNYANSGWSVFPCADKRPLTPNGFKDASKASATIEDWWSRHPEAQIGARTGKEAGYFVLDIDQPYGPETLKRLEAKFGPLPITAEQIYQAAVADTGSSNTPRGER